MSLKKSWHRCLGVMMSLTLLPIVTASALNFSLPKKGDDLVGEVKTGIVQPGDTFSTLARRYDVGYCELQEANPGIDPDHPPADSAIIIPTQYILPDVPRQGIVINLVELRLYYFPSDGRSVYVFPVGIGREGWESPLGVWSIIERTHLPTWHAPESIRVARAKEGTFIPKSVPPGPENPLGEYSMRLSNQTYLIHGTNDPSGVGRRSSAGCMRLYPEDIKQLFEMTHRGTPVRIINSPYKAGWKGQNLYLETHLTLTGVLAELDPKYRSAEEVLNRVISRKGAALVDWAKANAIAKEKQALPQEVGREAAQS